MDGYYRNDDPFQQCRPECGAMNGDLGRFLDCWYSICYVVYDGTAKGLVKRIVSHSKISTLCCINPSKDMRK